MFHFDQKKAALGAACRVIHLLSVIQCDEFFFSSIPKRSMKTKPLSSLLICQADIH
jgi:hypothetical protein